MPAFYNCTPGALQTTNATPNTENDCFFVKPGANRTLFFYEFKPRGAGASLTQISGIGFRLKKWTATSSSGGTAITPSPRQGSYAAASHTSGFAAGTVTPGTGGPTLLASFGAGSTTPGPWTAGRDLDQAYTVDGAQNQSLDIFNTCGAASQNFELDVGTAE
jgi:hypothetical protein